MWENQEEIPQLCALMSEEAKENTFRASVGKFIELEDTLSSLSIPYT